VRDQDLKRDAARHVLRLAHSPDPDDAFMWWPLFARDEEPRIDTGRFRFEQVTADIETLNRLAETSKRPNVQTSKETQPDSHPIHLDVSTFGGLDVCPLEITAISCAQYPHVQDRYVLTACGSSMGEQYGPKLVSRSPMRITDLKRDDVVVAVPGTRTSAFTALSIMLRKNSFRHAVVPFEQIIDRVAAGEFSAGLIIHEGQLTFANRGLHLIEDLGAWWWREHGLPLPLGVNVVRRDLEQLHGPGTLAEITDFLLQSVEYAMAHREESIRYALGFARDMKASQAAEFIDLYVNKLTLDFGDVGRRAVEAFLRKAHEDGLAPAVKSIDFVAAASGSF
jgi:1,4-dihydroxy-6-naphthoate synthase